MSGDVAPPSTGYGFQPDQDLQALLPDLGTSFPENTISPSVTNAIFEQLAALLKQQASLDKQVSQSNEQLQSVDNKLNQVMQMLGGFYIHQQNTGVPQSQIHPAMQLYNEQPPHGYSCEPQYAHPGNPHHPHGNPPPSLLSQQYPHSQHHSRHRFRPDRGNQLPPAPILGTNTD